MRGRENSHQRNGALNNEEIARAGKNRGDNFRMVFTDSRKRFMLENIVVKTLVTLEEIRFDGKDKDAMAGIMVRYARNMALS